MSKQLITTIDNPINPHTDFDNWYNYDVHVLGYRTYERLARMSATSTQLPDPVNEEELDQAIQLLLETDVLGVYYLLDEGKEPFKE